jgi:S-adenosylmethionine decarboxylase
MAYNDTLFQLGMDLTRSSTAQKEDLSAKTAHIAHTHDDEARKDFFIERDGVRFAGTHLIIDLFGARRLDDIKHIERTLKRCVEVAGATLLHIHLHHFTPNGGVSGVAVLSESHISIHSWPEADYAALDVFMCGEAKPHLSIAVLKEAFEASDVVVKEHLRGEELDQLEWQAAARKPVAKTIRNAPPAGGQPKVGREAPGRTGKREKLREVVAA